MSSDRGWFFLALFFKKDVLAEFKRVKMSTPYLGEIQDKGVGITFGLTNKGNVCLWLGDYVGLSEATRAVFVPYYASPDSLGRHFVKSQVKGEFVKPADPN